MSGPGQVQNNFNVQPGGLDELLNAAAAGRLQGRVRQPADPARGRRPALRAAGVRARSGRRRRTRCCRRCSSSFGDQIGFADTLDEALDQVFGGGATAPAAPTPRRAAARHGATPPPRRRAGGGSPTPRRPARQARQTLEARAGAGAARREPGVQDAAAGLAENDFAGYGAAQQRLRQTCKRASPRRSSSARRRRAPRERRADARTDEMSPARPGRDGFAAAPGAPVSWSTDAGWSSSVARWAHNPEVAGSNPAPATKKYQVRGRIPDQPGSGL